MILLDYRDKRPIYEQMVEKLERLIVSGGLEQGSKMPSVRSLAVELAVNPNTVQRAYTLLEQEGYLYTITGRGSFVAPEREWRDGQRRRVLAAWVAMTRRARDAGLTHEILGEHLTQVYSQAREEENTPPGGEVPGNGKEAPPGGEAPDNGKEAPPGGEVPGNEKEAPPGGEAPGSRKKVPGSAEGGNYDRSDRFTEKL